MLFLSIKYSSSSNLLLMLLFLYCRILRLLLSSVWVSGGGGGVVGVWVMGGGGVGWCVQHGRFHGGLFLRSFKVFSPEHFMCSHWWHFEHSTEVVESGLLQIGQIKGHGFCSIPALSSRS